MVDLSVLILAKMKNVTLQIVLKVVILQKK